MAILAFALPVMPGQADAARSLAAELDSTGHRSRYEELNRSAGITRHVEWVLSGSAGDQLIVVFETDTPERISRPFGDNDYDRWWVRRFKRIHGFDPATPGPPPELTFSWVSD
jgi:hypothetical protein